MSNGGQVLRIVIWQHQFVWKATSQPWVCFHQTLHFIIITGKNHKNIGPVVFYFRQQMRIASLENLSPLASAYASSRKRHPPRAMSKISRIFGAVWPQYSPFNSSALRSMKTSFFKTP